MTSVSFPDKRATSPGGRFSAEALSPENGAVPFPDSVPEKDRHAKSFGFQRNFRYRLINASGQVVWERWQPEREPAPTNLYVSDAGHVVAGLHGYTAAPTVFFDGHGKIAFTVNVCTDWEGIAENPDFSRETAVGSKMVLWKDEHIVDSSAGIFWYRNSLPCFFSHADSHYFSVRSAWSRRLVANLDAHVVLSDAELAAGFGRLTALQTVEAAIARRVVANAAHEIGTTKSVRGLPTSYGDDDADPLASLKEKVLLLAAIDVAGALKLKDLVPAMRKLEAVSSRGYSTSSNAFEGSRNISYDVHAQSLRPIVQQSLWRLGEVPKRFANYVFTHADDDDDFGHEKKPFKMPEPVPDLEARAARLRSGMHAPEVLALLGSPTFVRSSSVESSPGKFVWFEVWEYDLLRGTNASTLSITWGAQSSGVIERIEDVLPPWQAPAGRPYLYH